MEYQIFNGIWELTPTEETVRSFKSFVAKRVIKIFKSHFEIDKFIVDIMKTGRELQISHCNLDFEMIIISSSDFLTLFSLHIKHGSVSHSRFWIKLKKETSFIYINIIDVNMVDVLFAKYKYYGQGKVGFHV